jgi:hypothetical protein
MLFSMEWTYARIKGDERLINRSVQALGFLVLIELLNLGAHEECISLDILVSSPSEAETAALSDTESVRHHLVQVHVETIVRR